MPTSSWLFLAYGAALFYLLLHRDPIKDAQNFRWAWFAYVVSFLPGALSAFAWTRAVFVVLCWLCVIVSATFLYFAIDPIFRPPDDEGRNRSQV